MSFDWAPPEIGPPGPSLVARAPQAQPYRPDTVIDGWSAEGFAVCAASVRGPAHRAAGVPRQDEFALATRPGAVIAVVADGVSNAALSHLGATVACRTVVDYLLRVGAEAGVEAEAEVDAEAPVDIDWHDLLRCAGWALVDYADRQLGGADAARAESLLASTVVVALVQPDGPGRAVARLVRVGDSGAWRLRDGKWESLFPADEGELLPDGVEALPRVPVAVTPVVVPLTSADVLVLGTDGFAEALGDGGTELGRLVGSGLAAPPPLGRMAWMLDFAGARYDDDRTVVALWTAPGPA